MHDHGHFGHLFHTMDGFGVGVLIAVVWFSFLMSWHCGVMCGPIVCARFTSMAGSRRRLLVDAALYNSGRLVSYTIMGTTVAGLAGFLSDGLSVVTVYGGYVVAGVFACVLMAQGFMLLAGREWSWLPARWGRVIGPLLRLSLIRDGGPLSGFVLGLVTAVLPCMTLAAALAAAATAPGLVEGGLLLFAFAAGTVPAMMIVPLVAGDLSALANNRWSARSIRFVGGLLLICASILTLLRMAT